MSAQVHVYITLRRIRRKEICKKKSSLLLNSCIGVAVLLIRPYLQLFQVRSLHADHRGQQLVLQAVSGHCEIDQGALGLLLRLVMRAGELGVQDEAEAGVVLALLVSDLYVPVWVNEERSSSDHLQSLNGSKDSEMARCYRSRHQLRRIGHFNSHAIIICLSSQRLSEVFLYSDKLFLFLMSSTLV